MRRKVLNIYDASYVSTFVDREYNYEIYRRETGITFVSIEHYLEEVKASMFCKKLCKTQLRQEDGGQSKTIRLSSQEKILWESYQPLFMTRAYYLMYDQKRIHLTRFLSQEYNSAPIPDLNKECLNTARVHFLENIVPKVPGYKLLQK